MSSIISLSAAALVLAVAVALNPSPRQYRRYVYRKLCQRSQLESREAQATCALLRAMPTPMREGALGQYVSRRNYGVFSVYVLDAPTLHDESLGIFGLFMDWQRDSQLEEPEESGILFNWIPAASD